MATITTRSGKGSPLTNNEVDSNFENLNTDKVEKSGDTLTGNLNFGDNNKIQLGASNDLQIYHAGTASYIVDTGTGNLNLQTDGAGIDLLGNSGTDFMARFTSNGAASLWYDGSLKLSTTSTGIDVTGNVVADGLDVNGSFPTMYLRSTATSTNYRLANNGDGSLTIVETNGLTYVGQRMKIADGGDVSFYEDTGTTPKFFWDASAESLGIGTSTPSAPLEISTAGSTAPRITSSDGLGDAVMRFYSGATYKGQIGWDQSSDKLGIYSSGNSGVPSISIDISGNVGIGTTSPSSLLHLKAATPIIRLEDTGGFQHYINSNNSELRLQGAGSVSVRTPAAGTHVDFRVADSEVARFTTTGLGIGTTSPAAKLHVDGSIKLDGNYPVGTGNVGLGLNALDSVVSGGAYNVAIGSSALTSVTTGGYNVAIGGLVAANATTAIYNIGIGMSALESLTTGYNNTAIGNSALKELTTQIGNVAVGDNALQNNVAGTNTAVGRSALRNNTTGTANVAVGYDAASSVTTGSSNSFFGTQSGTSLTTGSQNTGIGRQALQNLSTAFNNVAIGYFSANALTTGSANVIIGSYAGDSLTSATNNTAVGYAALGANETGTRNDAFGAEALYSNTGNYNSAFGSKALYSNTTGSENVAFGYQTLYSNTTGEDNTALGQATLYSNTTGGYNTAVGRLALAANTTANYNTGIGYNALNDNTTGLSNTAVGALALDALTTGNNNVAVGYEALSAATTSSYNTALGDSALQSTTSGTQNIAVGYESLNGNTTGSYSVAVGFRAAKANTTATFQTAVGYAALLANTTGSNNTAVGAYSGTGLTTGGNNDAFGYGAMRYATTAAFNVALGIGTLQNNTGGQRNVGIGHAAGRDGTSGNDNIFVGYTAGLATTGSQNVAIGANSLRENTSGVNNVSVGHSALRNSTTGSSSVAVGMEALNDVTTGHSNTAVGREAGSKITTGTGHVILGYAAGNAATTASELVAIGKQAFQSSTTGNQVAIGTSAGYYNTTGWGNTFVGHTAARSNTTAGANVVLGSSAAYNQTTGGNNTALGYATLYTNSTGQGNTAVGRNTLYNATGSSNTAVGQNAGYEITTGQKNTILGKFNGNQGGLDIRTSDNNIVLSDGSGNPRVVVDSSGNMGVGQVSPSQKLHLSNAGAVAIRATNATNSVQLDMGASTGTVYIGAGTSHPLVFQTGFTERMRIDSSGNVGIGTSSPAHALDISGGKIQVNDGGATWFGSDATGGYARTFNGNTFRFLRSDSSESMRIDSAGRVGIGTSSPSTDALHVVASDLSNDDDTIVLGANYNSATILGSIGTHHLDVNNGGLKFSSKTAGTLTERMRIDSSGNVGIGTSIPGNFNSSAERLVVGAGAGDEGITVYSSSTGRGSLFFADSASGTAAYSGYVQYNHNSNYMVFGTNSQTWLTITSDGKVGINRTSPSSALHVSTSSAGPVELARFRNENQTNNTGFFFSTDESTKVSEIDASGSTAGNAMALATSGVEKVRIDSSGNVGIATSTPSYVLDVAGTGRINNGIYLNNASSGGFLYEQNAQPLRFGTAGTERMRIDSTGKVGIGTSAPDTELSIESGTPFIQISGDSSSYVNAGIQFISEHASTLRGMGSFYYSEHSDVEWFVGLPYNNNDVFVINRNTGYTAPSSQSSPPGIGASAGELMRIDAAGRVGIGTNNPVQKLHVASSGSARIRLQDTDTAKATASSLIEFNGSDGRGAYTGISAGAFVTDLEAGTRITWLLAGSEKMRIDSSGNLLVGKTFANVGNDGAQFLTSGYSGVSATSTTAFFANRNTTDGDIVEIGRNGVKVGSIGTASSGNFYIEGSGNHSGFEFGTNVIAPFKQGAATDGVCNLGGVLNRFQDLHLSNQANIDLTEIFDSTVTAKSGNDLTVGARSGQNLKLLANGAEKARLDAAGNLLVGKTSANQFTAAGHEIYSNGLLVSTRDGGNVAVFNRETSHGQIMQFRKDNAQIGDMGSKDGDLYIRHGSAGLLFSDGAVGLLPAGENGNAQDGTVILGNSGARFKDLFLSGGVYVGGTGSANKLDDYEEGTWTPVYEPSSGSFTTMTMEVILAKYTKVGNLVTVNCYIRTDDVDATGASGSVNIAGLPFTSVSSCAANVGYANNFTTKAPAGGFASGSIIRLTLPENSGGIASYPVSNITTGTTANQNEIVLTCTYHTTA